MYNKFESIWTKLEIEDFHVSKACAENLKKVAWLIYLIAKQKIFERYPSCPQP